MFASTHTIEAPSNTAENLLTCTDKRRSVFTRLASLSTLYLHHTLQQPVGTRIDWPLARTRPAATSISHTLLIVVCLLTDYRYSLGTRLDSHFLLLLYHVARFLIATLLPLPSSWLLTSMYEDNGKKKKKKISVPRLSISVYRGRMEILEQGCIRIPVICSYGNCSL